MMPNWLELVIRQGRELMRERDEARRWSAAWKRAAKTFRNYIRDMDEARCFWRDGYHHRTKERDEARDIARRLKHNYAHAIKALEELNVDISAFEQAECMFERDFYKLKRVAVAAKIVHGGYCHAGVDVTVTHLPETCDWCALTIALKDVEGLIK